jgi:hypothetical protein
MPADNQPGAFATSVTLERKSVYAGMVNMLDPAPDNPRRRLLGQARNRQRVERHLAEPPEPMTRPPTGAT